MKLSDICPFVFSKELQRIQSLPLYRHPSAYLWRKSLSIRNQFCEAVVNVGYLSFEQMASAASRYCLGASKQGGVIFWQIDHEGRVHDGKVMYYLPDCHRNKSKGAHPTWVSTLLARRQGGKHQGDTTSHCFFGLHLLGHADLYHHTSSICIVESEKSAVILSELYPHCIWLAAGGLGEVQPDKFRPLRGRKVILFPDTDSNGTAYRRWSEAAQVVMRQPFWEDSPSIRVSPLLELHATPEQKQRKIDLIDFLYENHILTTRKPYTYGA
jgi:hypothetical protein